jgi:hypothetical protein
MYRLADGRFRQALSLATRAQDREGQAEAKKGIETVRATIRSIQSGMVCDVWSATQVALGRTD